MAKFLHFEFWFWHSFWFFAIYKSLPFVASKFGSSFLRTVFPPKSIVVLWFIVFLRFIRVSLRDLSIRSFSCLAALSTSSQYVFTDFLNTNLQTFPPTFFNWKRNEISYWPKKRFFSQFWAFDKIKTNFLEHSVEKNSWKHVVSLTFDPGL